MQRRSLTSYKSFKWQVYLMGFMAILIILSYTLFDFFEFETASDIVLQYGLIPMLIGAYVFAKKMIVLTDKETEGTAKQTVEFKIILFIVYAVIFYLIAVYATIFLNALLGHQEVLPGKHQITYATDSKPTKYGVVYHKVRIYLPEKSRFVTLSLDRSYVGVDSLEKQLVVGSLGMLYAWE